MKEAVLVLLLLVLSLVRGVVYPTSSDDGFEVIWLDYPSYLSQIYHGYNESILYIFGEDSLRLVQTAPQFSVVDNPLTAWFFPFLSLFVFHDTNNVLWGIGPMVPNDNSALSAGYTLPIALVGPSTNQDQIEGLQGSTFYSVWVDSRNLADVQSYFVGYIDTSTNTSKHVALGVVRTHININQPPGQRQFTYNPATDLIYLTSDRFFPFSQHFRPQLHFSYTSNILIVVDPATGAVWSITTSSSGLSQGAYGIISFPRTTITSSFYQASSNLLYVGFAGQGNGTGVLASYSTTQIIRQQHIQFNGTLGNPRALAYDESSNSIYVGFNGGDAILRLNATSLAITGFQRVPDYLTKIEGAAVGRDHIYFITNEQHAKVLRLRKEDFCTSHCPYYGYCVSGKCKCQQYYSLTKDDIECKIDVASKAEKGAATALGVLFALSLVAGAIGWVLFWRARKGSYQAV